MNILQLMMTFLNSLPTILTPLKYAFEALGKLFDRLGADKAQSIAQEAYDLVKDIENNSAFADKWFRDYFGDLDALLKYWPGVSKLVYVAHNTKEDQRCDLHTALVATELEVNVLKMSQKP